MSSRYYRMFEVDPGHVLSQSLLASPSDAFLKPFQFPCGCTSFGILFKNYYILIVIIIALLDIHREFHVKHPT